MTDNIPIVLKPTYNPKCPDYHEYLGCCKLGDMLICREETCPKNKEA